MPTGAGLSLATLRTEVLSELGIDSDDLDASGSTELDLLINRSWWEIMDKFDFREKEASSTFDTVSGTSEYDIVAEIDPIIWDALQNVSINDPDSEQQTNLIAKTIQWYRANYNANTELYAMPTNYIRSNNNIILFQTPDDAYTITLDHLAILADVPSAGPQCPQSWHEVIMYGAVWRGHMKFRDYNSANAVKAHQISLIATSQTNSGKEDKMASKLYGVSVPTREFGRRY